MAAGEIQIKLTLDNGQFSVETKKAGETIQELKRSLDRTADSSQALERHFTSLYTKFHDTVRTASLLRYALHDVSDIFTMLPGAILKSAGEMERLQKLMEGMSKATDDYAKKAEAISNVKFVYGLAQNAPFEVKSLTDAFVKFKSAGLDPTNGSMKGLVDSVAKFGGTSDTLHRASIAIQQMAGKGVISMEELRQQLGEAVPNAINLMAEGAGMSVQKFANLVKTGSVQAGDSLRNMFTVMQIENKGASEAMMDTWSGLLSLLQTKFELFKVEAATGGEGGKGFFQESKDAIRELIEMFDSLKAKEVAQTIGSVFADMVKAIKSTIEFFIKYGDEIKTVGELLLMYWGATKLTELFGGVKAIFSQRMRLYEEEIVKAEESNRRKAALVEQEAAVLRRKAQQEEAFAARQTQLAGQLYAEQAKYANQIAALEARNLGWAGQQKIDRLNARLQETRQAIVEIQNEAVARRGTADTLIKQAEAHERVAAAQRMGTMASAADNVVVRQVNEHAQKTVQLLHDKAGAADRATSGISLLQRTMSGAGVVFDMFGGWVGVAVATLGYLADKLYEFLNRWKEAEEIQRKIKQGIASEDNNKKLQTRIDETDKDIAGTQNYLNTHSRPEMGKVDPKSSRGIQIAQDQKLYDDQIAELERLKAQRNQLIKDLRDGENILSKQTADTEASAYKRQLTNDIAKRFAFDNAEVKRLQQEIDDKQGELLKKGANSVEVEKAGAEQRKRIIAIRQKSAQEQLDYLQDERTKLAAELEKTAGKEARDKINAKLDVLNDTRQGLIKGAIQLRDDSLKLGQIGLVKKPENEKAEDPLLRYVIEKENNLAKAKLKLENNTKGIADLVTKQNEAAIEVLGKLAHGDFDKSLGKDENQVGKRDYKGGLDERKKMVQEFIGTLQSGNGDVNTFVSNLASLNEEQKKLILRAIDASASEELMLERRKALDQATRQEVKTAEDAEAALISLNANGYVKMSEEMLRLEKFFATLGVTIKSVSADMTEFARAKEAAFTNQALADARKWVTEQIKGVRDVEQANVKATQSVSEAAEAQHRDNMRRIQEQADAHEAMLMQQLANETATTAQKEALIKELSRVQIAAENARAAETRRYEIETNREMINLRKSWSDTTTAMNQLSVNWSGTFMNNLVDLISGTKVNWKAMVSSMAKDLMGVILKKQFGDMITSAFSSLTGSIGKSLFGATAASSAGNAAGAAAGATGQAATTTAMTTMSTATTTAMTTMTTEMTTGVTGMTAAMGEMSLGMTAALTEMVTTVTTAMAAMVEAAWAGAAFADGGIMTSSGPLPLNAYANGGVANKPQVALFGEGSTPEAYVPLPDGRTIPVTMTGGMPASSNTSTQTGVVINIQVNQDGSDKTESSGKDAENWKVIGEKVRAVIMEQLVVQQRPGGVLYNK
jgi:tape measure domain-containing protein